MLTLPADSEVNLTPKMFPEMLPETPKQNRVAFPSAQLSSGNSPIQVQVQTQCPLAVRLSMSLSAEPQSPHLGNGGKDSSPHWAAGPSPGKWGQGQFPVTGLLQGWVRSRT